MSTYRQNPLANIPPVVKNLLIINVICFLPTLLFNGDNAEKYLKLFGVFYFDSPFFKPWQIITHLFLHGNFMHILFNMFALYSFGTAIEYTLGSKRFFSYYFICGLGAIALQMAVQAFEVHAVTGHIANDLNHMPDLSAGSVRKLQEIYFGPMVGASGAIFGLLIAFGMLFPNAELMLLFVPVPIKAKYIIPVYIVIELVLGVGQFAGDSVAHFAHLGGALLGFILIKAWRIQRPDRFM